jgi:23S rRNA (uracil1939-C5)-methyltransferase
MLRKRTRTTRVMNTPDQYCKIEIEEMTLGPYGVGHVDGKAMLVANSVQGDVLQVSISGSRRDYSIGRLDRIVSPGPARRDPPCPFLPRCGGCDWQQISYPEQAAAKGRLIAAQLNRALGLELDPAGLIVAAPAEFGYRSRLRLKVRGKGRLGFFELGSNRFVAVDRCLLAGDDLSFDPARQLASVLAHRCDEIELVKAGERQALVAYLRGPVRPADIKGAQIVAADRAVAGIVLRGGRDRVAIGEPLVTIELEPGLQLTAAADAFSQVNQQFNRQLVAAVMEQAAIKPDATVLDLFCGAGNFSLPMAKRGGQVLGVDADPVAIDAARQNAEGLGLSGARFVAMEAQDMTPFLLRAGYRPETVILDPPRSGAQELMKTIVKLSAARVLYVSCDVPTLARDLRVLTEDGYAISSVKGFDFFPNTHHCEVLALLT